MASSGRESFAIRLNHRALLRALMEATGVPPALEDEALVAIDKLDKIGLDGVRRELLERGDRRGRCRPAAGDHGRGAGQDNAELLAWLEAAAAATRRRAARRVADLRRVLELSARGRRRTDLRVDPYLARGPQLLHRPDLRDRVSGPQRVGWRRRPLR